jgi:hypothetical protein
MIHRKLLVIALLLLSDVSSAFHLVIGERRVRIPSARFVSKLDKPEDSSRRDVLKSALLSGTATVGVASSSPANGVTSSGLLADLPMIRLRLPGNALGEGFVVIPICINGESYEFMLDTGLTLELMTPNLQKKLNLKADRSGMTALTAAGSSSGTSIVTLRGAKICNSPVELPEMHASVMDFPQEHIDPKHDPVDGMLGQEVLSQFDLDLDFPNQRVRLYAPGTAEKQGLVEIPAIVINETGLLGFRLSTGGQPILAFIDCGSTFSALNWKAAAILGLPDRSDPIYRKGPFVVAVGVDGRPVQLPTFTQTLSFTGNAITDGQGRIVGFEPPPRQWKAWKPVSLAVGDLPVFPELLGDGRTPYTGPAGLIGLDVIAQRRVIVESGGNAKTRQRRIFVSPS